MVAPMIATRSPPRTPLSQTTRGIAFLFLAILFFTAMDAAAKGLVQRYPSPLVIWARYAGQLLVVLALLRGRTGQMLRTRWPGLHLLRSICQFGATALFFASLTQVSLAEATALTDTNAVLITLGAALFLGERLTPARVLGVLVALAGALIVLRPGLGVFTPAALLPLGAAISYAGNALLTRALGPHESPWTPLIFAALFGTLVTSLALPIVWHPIAMADLPLFVLLGLLGTGAQLCIIRAFSLAEASVIAPFGYVGLVFATLWGIVLYAEYPDLPTILGAVLIVAAGLYVWHNESRPH